MCDHCGCGTNHHHESGDRTERQRVELEQDILAHDKHHADSLRSKLHSWNSSMINVVGSPGCGKTALIAELIPLLKKQNIKTAVVEGDLATDNDAKRIAKTGAPVYQVMTGTACHLSAHDVEHAIDHLDASKDTLIFVENVGNLVCPSMFDIGESLRIVCLSVTEGTDKPQKYPVSFREADLAIISKCDLLEHVDFDIDECSHMINQIHPQLEIIKTSAKSGLGMGELTERITQLCRKKP